MPIAAGDIPTAAELNRGVVGVASAASNLALTGAYQLVTSVTFNVVSAADYYQVVYSDRVTGTGAGNARVKATWVAGASPSAVGTTIGREAQTPPGGASNAAAPIMPYIVHHATALTVGQVTVGIYALLSSGTSAAVRTAADLTVTNLGG